MLSSVHVLFNMGGTWWYDYRRSRLVGLKFLAKTQRLLCFSLLHAHTVRRMAYVVTCPICSMQGSDLMLLVQAQGSASCIVAVSTLLSAVMS